MQRPLLLADHRPGHPFRQSFRRTRAEVRRRREDSDLRLFALSFAAFFVCFYTFLL